MERERQYATAAFLRRSAAKGSLQLKAGNDQGAAKGYICNVTFHSKDSNNNSNNCSRYPWVHHGPLTWEAARTACTNSSGRLLELPSDDEALTVIASEQDLCVDRDYWVGLSRRTSSLWLDGTPVKVPILYSDFGKTACLTMLMTATGPIFTFESCGGIALQALCEKDTDVHTNTFDHDDQGNHIDRSTAAKVNDYSLTVSILIAALVILTLLTCILGIFLCNKKLLIPRKATLLTSFVKLSGTTDQAPSHTEPIKQTSREARCKRKRNFFNFPKKSRKSCKRQNKKEEVLPKMSAENRRGSLTPAMSAHASYAFVNKSCKQNAAFAPAHRPQTIGSDADPHLYPDALYGASPPGSVVEYTEVSLRDFQDVDDWSACGGHCSRAPREVLLDQGRKGLSVTADGNRSGDDGLLMTQRSSSELILSPMALYSDYEIPATCLAEAGVSGPPSGLFSGRSNGPDKSGLPVPEARHDFLRPTVKLLHNPRRADSSQSSTTGSDDAYSILNYKQQINRAWTGLNRSQAYSHVIVDNMPAADMSSARADRGLTRHHSLDHHDIGSKLSPATFITEAPAPDIRHGADRVTGGPYDVIDGVYDVAHSGKTLQRPRCIDNVYDHAEPLQPAVGMRKCSASAVSHLLRSFTSWPPTSQSAPNTPSQRQRTLSYSYTVPHMRTLNQTFAAGAMSLTRSESEV